MPGEPIVVAGDGFSRPGEAGVAVMRFEALGPLRVRTDDDYLPLGAARMRLVLGVLLARATRPVGVSELIDALWEHNPPEKALKNLQIYIHRLRRLLGDSDRIRYGPAGYLIVVLPGELDVNDFTDLLQWAATAQQAGELDHAAGLLDQALGLWRGRPYGGLEDSSTLAGEVERLNELRAQALEDQLGIALVRGRHVELLPQLSALVGEFPYREGFPAQFMVALYRSGRQADALAVYRRTRDRLVGDLGIEPGRDLRELHDAILHGEPALDLDRYRAVRGPVAPTGTLPAQLPPDLTMLTGRQEELRTLLAIAGSAGNGGTPTVTVIDGMAGVGKTALAVHAAHRLAKDFPDGQVFLDLHGFTQGVEPIQPLIALDRLLRSIGVSGGHVPTSVDEGSGLWRSRLREKRVLIVLDNAVSEEQVRPLLPASPGCLVIVTSRHWLGGLDEAQPLSLDVLSPADAATLFSRIVGSERLAAEPLELREEAVRLCGRLPLAIRMLAARLRSRPRWTLEDLVRMLREERNHLPRLDGGRQSLVGAFELSYRQLNDAQRKVFRLLGLHPGFGFDGYAAAAVAGIDLRQSDETLESLADMHLLETRSFGRYAFHDLLRAYAAHAIDREESQEERRQALSRLLDYYLFSATNAMNVYTPGDRQSRPDVPAPPTPYPSFVDFDQAQTWLDAERANLLTLVPYAADNEFPQYVGRFSTCLYRYLATRWFSAEALALHGAAVRVTRQQSDLSGEARALCYLGVTHQIMGANADAIQCFQQALRVLDQAEDPVYRAIVLGELGSTLYLSGRLQEAVDYCRQAAEMHRLGGNQTEEAMALLRLGGISQVLGRTDEACAYFLDALVKARASNTRTVEGWVLRELGHTYGGLGRFDVALDHIQAGLRISREIGNHGGETYTLSRSATVLRRMGRHAEALEHGRQALAIASEFGDRISECEAHLVVGEALVAAGRAEEALTQFERALELAKLVQQPYDEARARQGLAYAFRDLGDDDQMRRYGRQAVEAYHRLGTPDGDALADLPEP